MAKAFTEVSLANAHFAATVLHFAATVWVCFAYAGGCGIRISFADVKYEHDNITETTRLRNVILDENQDPAFATISLFGALIAFEAITTVAHLLQFSLNNVGADKLICIVLRWVEYGITAPTMWVVILLSLGWRTLDILAPQVLLMCVLQAVGLAIALGIEYPPTRLLHGAAATQKILLLLWVWSFTVFACLLAPTVWLYATLPSGDAGPPLWVKVLVMGELAMFSLFGVLLLYDITCMRKYASSEFSYIALSFTSKFFLVAIFVFQARVACDHFQ